MSYCINPKCKQRKNKDEQKICANCGTPLLIKNRYRLIQPLRPLYIQNNCEIWKVKEGEKSKVMKILATDEPQLVALLEREAEVLKTLNHPQIPKAESDCFFTIIPPNSSQELYCLVMEYIKGENLEEFVTRHGKISQYQALNWLKQLLDILKYIHENFYFHRDIKPSNIILKPDGKLALIDFGSVRAMRSSYFVKSRLEGNLPDFLQITKIISEGYTAPEQVEGRALPQSDFYALGRTFVHLITGKSPIYFYSPNINKLIWRQEAKQITKPLADLIDDMMNPMVKKRPLNPQDIAERLTKWDLFWREWIISAKGFACFLSLGIIIYLCLLFGSKVLANNYFKQAKKNIPNHNIEELYSLNKEQLKQRKEYLEKEIKEHLEKAVKLNPYNSEYSEKLAEVYSSLGQQYLVENELSQARLNFEKAINLNSKKAQFHNDLGLVCKLEKDFRCAINEYEKALQLSQDNQQMAIINYNLGTIYEDIGNINGAIKHYLLAISTEYKISLLAANNYARLQIFYQQNNLLALSYLENALKKTDQLINNLQDKSGEEHQELLQVKSTLFKNIGWAYLQSGELAKAQKYLEQSLKFRQEKQAAPYCLLAQVEQHLDLKKSLELWQKCEQYKNDNNLPEVQIWQLYATQYLKNQGEKP